MSKLLQIWSEAYIFNEQEISTFAEIQVELLDPLAGLQRHQAHEQKDIWQSMPSNTSHSIILDQVAKEEEHNFQELTSAFLSLSSNATIIESCNRMLIELRQIGEDIVLRHEEEQHDQSINLLKRQMEPYVQYNALARYAATASRSRKDCFNADYAKCISAVAKNIVALRSQTYSDHIDADSFKKLYDELANFLAADLKSLAIEEIDEVTKASSSRIKRFSPSLLADINAEFMITARKLVLVVDPLLAAAGSHEKLADAASSVVNRFLSCRNSLLNHLVAAIEEVGEPQEQLVTLINALRLILDRERHIAEAYFGTSFIQEESTFVSSIENFIYSVLRKIRDLTFQSANKLNTDQVMDTLRSFEQTKFNNEQRRVVALLGEFFSLK